MAKKSPPKKAPTKVGADAIPEAYRQAALEAWRQTEVELASDPSRNISDPKLAIYRFVAMNDLLVEKARFEAGDKNALLGAIRICANHDLVMPEWLARAFIKGYDKVLRHDVASWDDAFGRAFPKGKHLNAARKNRNKAPAVWLKVRQLHDEGRGKAIDVAFEEVGKQLGLGKTQVSEYYYHMNARMHLSPASQVLLDEYRVPEENKTLRKDNKKS